MPARARAKSLPLLSALPALELSLFLCGFLLLGLTG